MRCLRLSSIVLVLLCLSLIFGCDKRKDESRVDSSAISDSNARTRTGDTEGTQNKDGITQRHTNTILVNDVVSLWEADRKAEAVKQFLTIQWNDMSIYRETQVLIMSEQEMRSLSEGEQIRIIEEAMKQTSRLRKLVKDVVSEGVTFVSSGDKIAAKAYLEAVQRYGEALSQTERLESIRDHGKAAIKYAQKQLSGIE